MPEFVHQKNLELVCITDSAQNRLAGFQARDSSPERRSIDVHALQQKVASIVAGMSFAFVVEYKMMVFLDRLGASSWCIWAHAWCPT
jgi:hypothetical protein